MTPGEVKGLQAIAMAHGGSLTVNPQTGLPEAGFLKSILPMIAGIALGPAGFGLTAMQAGLAAGAIGTVATGSLRKGIMAGLGAYGGAGIGDVLGKAGTAAIEAGAGALPPPVSDAGTMLGASTPPSPVAPVAAPVSSMAGGFDPISGLPMSPVVGGPMNLALPQGTPLGPAVVDPMGGFPKAAVRVPPSGAYTVDPTGGLPGSQAAAAPVIATPQLPVTTTPQPPTVSMPDTYRNQMDIRSDASVAAKEAALREAGPMQRLTKGLGAIAEKPSLLFNKENMKYGAAALAPIMLQEQKAVNAPRDSEQYRYAYDPGRQMPPTREGDVGEYTYYRPSYTRLAADGGLMDAMPVERMSERNDAQMMMVNSPQMYAGGGLSHLGDYSDGGRLLRGPGDGVSDDIPATIANKRPARLADGEFVVPARIVSELGNGSTDAGARKLYAMMDRVQQNRRKTVGKNKVAVNSRSEKLLPA
jgi:hypothetical protein